jgi:hypothetical protein
MEETQTPKYEISHYNFFSETLLIEKKKVKKIKK